ncbi:flagellin lysine-N-methylase [Enterovibrio makurazakiensis]|uniref:flagellin lysine-N-methylase n=1 Tax=Enterovibrio makurazakiensis TaxID=2910232 RepID=UPI003D1A2F59
MNKITVTPQFYKEFACTGSACEDHCCHSWNVNIDKSTYQFMTRKSAFKAKAAEVIERTRGQAAYAKIKLNQQGNCPFRMESGLCEVHAEHGHTRLSNTCKTYPRLVKVRGNQVQHSLTLSCPEAVRKALLNPDAMSFDSKVTQEVAFKPAPYQRPAHHDAVRELFVLLLSEQSMPLEQRLFTFGFAIKHLSQVPAEEQADAFDQVIAQIQDGSIAEFYEGMPAVTQLHASYLLKGYNALFAVNILDKKPLILERLEKLHERMKSALIEAGDDVAQQQAVLEGGFAGNYQRYMDERAHVWVNYFIYQMYELDFPAENMYEQFSQIIVDFFYLRGALCLLAADATLTDDDFVLVVQSYHRARSHGGKFPKVLENMKGRFDVDSAMLPLLLLKVS